MFHYFIVFSFGNFGGMLCITKHKKIINLYAYTYIQVTCIYKCMYHDCKVWMSADLNGIFLSMKNKIKCYWGLVLKMNIFLKEKKNYNKLKVLPCPMKHDVTASINVYLCFINNIKHYTSYIKCMFILWC